MTVQVTFQFEMPSDLQEFKLPEGVNSRLQELLDRQDNGASLSEAENKEAEGLVNFAEFLSLLRLRTQRVARELN